MEPLSILGAASSIVSVIDVASRCISSLHALQQRWKDADMTVALIMGQISTLKAALEQISQWMHTDADTMLSHYQLAMDLDLALHSSRLSITFIHDHVTTLMWDEYNELTFKSKARAMAQVNMVQQCAKHLSNQTVALNLLLTALNCRSLSEQRSLLLDKKNREIIEQVKDDSSSLVVLLDSASLRSSRSCSTDRGSLWSRAFEFDGDLLGSKVYTGQIRLLMKRVIGKGAKPQQTSNLTACENNLEDKLREESQKSKDISKITAWEGFVKNSEEVLRRRSQKSQEILLRRRSKKSQEVLLRRRIIRSQEILLLGPDNYARIMLLEKLQYFFDPAGEISRYENFKDEFIRYHLPAVWHVFHTIFLYGGNVITLDEKANAALQWVCQNKKFFHAVESHTQVTDALTALWNDENIRQSLENAKTLDFWSPLVRWIEIECICHTLDMIAIPEVLPTAKDVAKLKQGKSEIENITFKVSRDPEKLYTHNDKKRKAQGESHNGGVVLFRFIDLPSGAECTSKQFDDVPIRIIVVDLLQLYQAAELPTIPEDGPRGRILQKLGVEEYMDNLWGFWYATLPNMIILTSGDAFLTKCGLDSWRKISLEKGSNDIIQSLRQSLKSQLDQELACLHSYDMKIHIMWNYDDAEVHRLGNAIRNFHARTATVEFQAA